jgi:hypothetical protein
MDGREKGVIAGIQQNLKTIKRIAFSSLALSSAMLHLDTAWSAKANGRDCPSIIRQLDSLPLCA